MIIFVYGTTAEAIKIAPVARRLARQGIPFEQWVTYQHVDTLDTLIEQLGLPQPDRVIARGARGRSLTTRIDVLRWLFAVWRWRFKNGGPLRRSTSRNSIVVVHGDTLTTVVGAWLARVLRLPSAHIEAGLRSGDWRHPFPEELDRRIVGRWATVHYAPSEDAVENLGDRDNVVFTHGNTVNDAVLDHGALEVTSQDPYGVVLLHRYEFISNSDLVRDTVQSIVSVATSRVVFIVDAYSREAITDMADNAPGVVEVRSKVDHADFVSLLRGAEYVVTDSGGVQEETALLGVPTLVHRMTTERQEGIGRNAVLSLWNQETVQQFLADYARYRVEVAADGRSPSDIIVADLVERGYART